MTWIWDGEKVSCGICGAQAMVLNAFNCRTGEPKTVVVCQGCSHETFRDNPFGGYEFPVETPERKAEIQAVAKRLDEKSHYTTPVARPVVTPSGASR